MRRVLSELLRWWRASERRRARPARRPTTANRNRPPAADTDSTAGLVVEYSPQLDGDPDPGEVVWTWVPYEEDPSQGKDRPVVVIGRRGGTLIGVPLTSKRHTDEEQVVVGSGPWDPAGRPSYAKVERLLQIDPTQVRREGAILDRGRFDDVVAGVDRARRR